LTRYVHDASRATIVSAWETPSGAVARDAIDVSGVEETHALRLAATLAALSEAAWETYTQPADAGEDDAERAAFDDVTDAITKPSLPDADGALLVSYIGVTEGAHRVGRALHTIGANAPTDTVLAEADAELKAIAQAELGDFSGRAAQALLLSRADPSPVQVAAANELLADDPLDHARLFSLDPAASAVAAAHWLKAAADVVADFSESSVEKVIREADWLEPMPVCTTVEVLSRLELGESPHDIVADLIREAMAVARGEALDPRRVIARVTKVESEEEIADRPSDLPPAPRLSVLDPARPALDLLEDLLAGPRLLAGLPHLRRRRRRRCRRGLRRCRE
jgi:hypothetical protein